MVRNKPSSFVGAVEATDSLLGARPAKPARAASYDISLPVGTSQQDAHVVSEQPHPEPRLVGRKPTTPTTPTFILSPSSLFGGGQDKAGEPMLLGGWSRSKGPQVKQRPSLHRPSKLLSDNTNTDVSSLASSHEKEHPRSGRGGLWALLPFSSTRDGGKHSRSLTMRRLCSSYKSLIAFVLLVVLFVRMLFAPSHDLERGVNGQIAKHKASDAVFLNSWIEHVIHHPVRARDKTGFAEMGLRTEMYSHLLQHPTLPNFDRMERALWPFVPGINQLRRWWQASVQAKPMPYSAASDKSTGGHSKLMSRAFGASAERQRGSRGIVMSLGYKGSVFASQFISVIRDKHKNNIPIELYYYGDSDLPAKYRNYLTKTYRNVRCIDLESLGLFDPDLVQLERQGFAIKPFAVLATNFTEVMLADADAILLEDPDHFFEEPGYIDTGTLFFHDRDHQRDGVNTIVHDFMNNQLSLRGPSPRLAQSEFWKKKGIFEQESGIVVVDKRKTDVFAALLFTAWQNMGEIRKKTTYRIWWGDKETFWLAFEFSRFPYYFVPRYAQAIGSARVRTKAERQAAIAAAKAKKAKAEGKVEEHDSLADAQDDGSEGEVEELCSEHPLHFLGADVEDNNGDGEVDAMTLGRPAWFNGGILDSKVDSDEVYIAPNAFTLDGSWEFLFDEERWCIRNYTRGNMDQFHLTPRIDEIKAVAAKAEAHFRAKIPKTTSAKQAALE
ncbi:hypothetical protein PaG_04140 [Moesziomyces aphidis]|uniref:Alpha-1,3-mannosyltransferase n=1 Tax=Moesziomyces aphidis TaxID=84754 RepID=W3VLM3_MOEAP|nr:hypothetical protein PaG_04140 [Moesziomyces aphidis]